MGRHAALRLWGLGGWAALAAAPGSDGDGPCDVERSRWRGFEVVGGCGLRAAAAEVAGLLAEKNLAAAAQRYAELLPTVGGDEVWPQLAEAAAERVVGVRSVTV